MIPKKRESYAPYLKITSENVSDKHKRKLVCERSNKVGENEEVEETNEGRIYFGRKSVVL